MKVLILGMFETCQYVTNDHKFFVNLTLVIMKYAQVGVYKTIICIKKIGKRK
jgi:hypothetical protein